MAARGCVWTYRGGEVCQHHQIRCPLLADVPIWISDPVASTLISIIFHITEDRAQLTKLRSEVAKASSPFDSGALKTMFHLNGVINEALRLHPSLPSSGLRHTPKEGITIAGQYIPGNVTVSAPRYSLGRRKFTKFRSQDFSEEWQLSLLTKGLMTSCRSDGIPSQRWFGTQPDSRLSLLVNGFQIPRFSIRLMYGYGPS